MVCVEHASTGIKSNSDYVVKVSFKGNKTAELKSSDKKSKGIGMCVLFLTLSLNYLNLIGPNLNMTEALDFFSIIHFIFFQNKYTYGDSSVI